MPIGKLELSLVAMTLWTYFALFCFNITPTRKGEEKDERLTTNGGLSLTVLGASSTDCPFPLLSLKNSPFITRNPNDFLLTILNLCREIFLEKLKRAWSFGRI
jgi:hypothetical protein